MAEKDTIFSSKIKYTGIFSFREIYSFLYEWITQETGLEEFSEDLEKKASECASSLKSVNYSLILESGVFYSWFFDANDNPVTDEFFAELLKEDFIVDEILEQKISETVSKIFDEKMRKIYQKRLLQIFYLLDLQDEIALRDNIALLAVQLKEVSNPNDFEFFKWIIRKSVYELFLRERASFDDDIVVETNIFARGQQRYRSAFSKEKLTEIIEDLRTCWSN